MSASRSSTIPVRAGGQTIVTFTDNNADTAIRKNDAFNRVTISEISEELMTSVELMPGMHYTLYNPTSKRITFRIPGGTRYNIVNYNNAGAVTAFSVDRGNAIPLQPGAAAVITINSGGGTVDMPGRANSFINVTEGAGSREYVIAQECIAGVTYTAANNTNSEIRITLRNRFITNTYTANFHNSSGELTRTSNIRGNDLVVLAGGRTVFTVGQNDLVFYHLSGLDVSIS
jgi:hypothetical protein